jgi:hypothetical protein
MIRGINQDNISIVKKEKPQIPKQLKQIISHMEIVIDHLMKIINIITNSSDSSMINVTGLDIMMHLSNLILALIFFLISKIWFNATRIPIISIIPNLILIMMSEKYYYIE